MIKRKWSSSSLRFLAIPKMRRRTLDCVYSTFTEHHDGDGVFLGTGGKVWTKQNTHPVKFPFLGVSWLIGNKKFPGCLTYIWRKKNISLFVCMNIKIDSIVCLILSLTSVKLCLYPSEQVSTCRFKFCEMTSAGRPERKRYYILSG